MLNLVKCFYRIVVGNMVLLSWRNVIGLSCFVQEWISCPLFTLEFSIFDHSRNFNMFITLKGDMCLVFYSTLPVEKRRRQKNYGNQNDLQSFLYL